MTLTDWRPSRVNVYDTVLPMRSASLSGTPSSLLSTVMSVSHATVRSLMSVSASRVSLASRTQVSYATQEMAFVRTMGGVFNTSTSNTSLVVAPSLSVTW